MDEILHKAIADMPQMTFRCSCGKEHTFCLHAMSIGRGALDDLPKAAEPFKNGKILVVFDNNTYEAAGKKAVRLLKENGFNVGELLFDCGKDVLIPDEKTIGRILQEQDPDTSLMIAVGSGVINDSVKFVTSRTKIPYIVVATAPSMDGYVSAGAPIISLGRKISPHGHLPYALIGDTDVLKTAPQDLIQAGFGDVVGKITAIADWDLSVKVNGEYRCDTCVALVQKALDECFRTADGLKTREEGSLRALFEALTMTGVAMALINVSRPASGAEHLLSHYWEMAYIARGKNPIHHGLQVGVAAVVVARFFALLADILPDGVGALCPPADEIEALLKRVGAPTSPAEIGLDRDLFYDSLLNGHAVRARYSVLRFAKENGRLEETAKKITEEMYG